MFFRWVFESLTAKAAQRFNNRQPCSGRFEHVVELAALSCEEGARDISGVVFQQLRAQRFNCLLYTSDAADE